MAIRRNGYFYNHQLSNYINQFMAVFSVFQVQIGKFGTQDERFISVPIHYGSQDRVVASIMAENTQNKPLRLPLFSAYLRNVTYQQQRAHGVGMERRNTYVPVGGLVPDDITVIHQRMPSPVDLEIELSVYASNTDQHFQIIEQIIPLFNPTLVIQTSDATFDWTRMTTIELTNYSIDTNYPSAGDRRFIQSTFSFKIPGWIDTPADVRTDFIEKIFLRVGTVDLTDATNFEIIGDLDGQQIPYELVTDGSNLDI